MEYANSTKLEQSIKEGKSEVVVYWTDVWANSDIAYANGTESEEDSKGQFHLIIAGGIKTAIDEFSFMTAIGTKQQLDDTIEYNCGGALIAPNIVLTAAHCVVTKEVPDYVRIGGAPLDDDALENQPVEISKIHVHPLYKRKEFYHDIALLELKEESLHSPACIWKNHTLNVENVTAIGYGQEVFAGPNTNELLKATLTIVPNENCSSYYPPYSKLLRGVVDTQICAGDFSGVRDTCQGDSGGPIVAHIGEWPYEYLYVLGITSFGQGCASGSPSIYVKISKYLDWMKDIVKQDFNCLSDEYIT